MANQKIRREKDVSNGKQYRKYVESWSLCDCRYDIRFENNTWNTKPMFKLSDKSGWKLWK